MQTENKQATNNDFVPLPSHLSPTELATYNHVDAIPYWSMGKCLASLQGSVTKHKTMGSGSAAIKPAKIRKAVIQRLESLIQSNNDSISIQQLVTDVINTQSYLIDQMIPLIMTQHTSSATIQPLDLPPLQGQSPDKMAQLNHHLMQLNHCLRQLEQRQPQHQKMQQQTQPYEETPEPDGDHMVPQSSAKLHKIEPKANYEQKLHEDAQRMKAVLQSMRKKDHRPDKKERKRQLKTKLPNHQLEYDDDDQ